MYHNKDGNTITISNEIGKGGEASVYNIQGSPNLVAKIYNQRHAIDERKLEKLEKMCKLFDAEISECFAWPESIIYTENNQPVGFIMANVHNPISNKLEYVKLLNLYSAQTRRKYFPHAEYKFMVHVALNIARALDTLHSKGVIIADLNESNVFVNNTDATVKLIDCDSYQIEDFLCDVGKADYTAPELPSDLRGVKRTTNHDCFALAVMLFLILVGKHPYSGLATPPELHQAIIQGMYCYGKDAKKKGISSQWPFSELYELLSDEIKGLFEQAFSTHKRPTAKDWINALEKYESELIKCTKDDGHWYHPNYRKCIWCELQKNGFCAFEQTSIVKKQYNESETNMDDDKKIIKNYIEYINELHRLVEITINVSDDWEQLPPIYKQVFKNDVDFFTDINSIRVLNESDIILQGYENLNPEAKKIQRHVLLFQNFLTKYYTPEFKYLGCMYQFYQEEMVPVSVSNFNIDLPCTDDWETL